MDVDVDEEDEEDEEEEGWRCGGCGVTSGSSCCCCCCLLAAGAVVVAAAAAASAAVVVVAVGSVCENLCKLSWSYPSELNSYDLRRPKRSSVREERQLLTIATRV